MHNSLSPKENLLRVLERRDPEYVPVRRLNGLVPGMAKVYYRGSIVNDGDLDRWGVRWAGGTPAGAEWEPRIQPYAVGHSVPDLAGLKNYRFPDPEEPGLMDGVFDGVDKANCLVLAEIEAGPFTRAFLMTGMETLLIGMTDQPAAVSDLLHGIADYQIGLVRRLAAEGAHAVRVADDFGAQNALMISPRMWRKFIKPELARIAASVKEAGLLFFLHSCGHIMEIVPDLIEIGVDVLDPIQAAANDHVVLKKQYGDRLTLQSGVNTQGALTQGTPEEVEAEVRLRMQILAPGGGYIMGPDNAIPVPEANYRAYLAAGARYGRYPPAA